MNFERLWIKREGSGRETPASTSYVFKLFEFFKVHVTFIILKGDIPKCELYNNFVIYSLSQLSLHTYNGWDQKGLGIQ